MDGRRKTGHESPLRKRAEETLAQTRDAIAGMPVADIQELVHDLQVHQIELEIQNEELRRTQLELQEARDRYTDLYDFAPVGYVTLDAAGTILEANLTATILLGTERMALVGRKLLHHIARPNLDTFRQRINEVFSTTSKTACDIWLASMESGIERYVCLQFVPAEEANGNRMCCYVTLTDITGLKRAEDAHRELESQLRHTHKMEAVGRLAGGIAHDFNNLLTVILGNAQSALLALRARPDRDDDGVLANAFSQIYKAGENGAALTRQLLTFSRKQVAEPRVLNLNTVMTGMQNMLRRLVGEHIEIELVQAPDIHPVRADKAQIEQAIMNLVVNAQDAMPEGGKLTLATANEMLNQSHAEEYVDSRIGPHVVITVRDTGTGMTAEIRRHMFEPFFTTKPVGKGTGLGLATVYGIVKQAGGHITIDSRPGKGATFKLYLPASQESFEPANNQCLAARAGGDETILLCEDDRRVRGFTRSSLAEAGYLVIEAVDGVDALKVASGHEGPIHLLLTDVVMPRMNGRQLAEEIRRTRPRLGVLFMSGYTSDVIDVEGDSLEDSGFIGKPFRLDELHQRIRAILDKAKA